MTRRKSAVRARLSLLKFCRVAERESSVVTWRLMSVRFRSLQLWGLSSFGRASVLQAEGGGIEARRSPLCPRRITGLKLGGYGPSDARSSRAGNTAKGGDRKGRLLFLLFGKWFSR